jgi:hypothetical protein
MKKPFSGRFIISGGFLSLSALNIPERGEWP